MNHIEMMQLAERVALQSLCKRAQVGAVVVDSLGWITKGRNHNAGGAIDCCEGADGKTLPEVMHAEAVAIGHATQRGASPETLYVTRQPCIDCARLITAAGIKSVYYRDADDKTWGLRWLAWHGVEVDSGWITGRVAESWAERNGVME